jgi:hypothetical protein
MPPELAGGKIDSLVDFDQGFRVVHGARKAPDAAVAEPSGSAKFSFASSLECPEHQENKPGSIMLFVDSSPLITCPSVSQISVEQVKSPLTA